MSLDQLLRPFEFEFFINGLIVATLSGALCGLVGVYVVLKGMSYIGHGLSHAIFGGLRGQRPARASTSSSGPEPGVLPRP